MVYKWQNMRQLYHLKKTELCIPWKFKLFASSTFRSAVNKQKATFAAPLFTRRHDNGCLIWCGVAGIYVILKEKSVNVDHINKAYLYIYSVWDHFSLFYLIPSLFVLILTDVEIKGRGQERARRRQRVWLFHWPLHHLVYSLWIE